MKMKKLLSGFVATAILASSLSLSAFAAVIDGDPINVKASVADGVYNAGQVINVDVDATNVPATSFDMYEFYLKYDSTKVDFTGADVGYASVEKVSITSDDDAYLDTQAEGDFIHVLYMDEKDIDITEVNDLGSFPFTVKEGAGDANIEFKVYGFGAGQYSAGEGLEFDLTTYAMGTSEAASAVIDTVAPVISGVNASYKEGEAVSGSVAETNAVSVSYKLMDGTSEPVDVTVTDGAFSISDLAVGQYTLTAVDAAGNKAEVLFNVIADVVGQEIELQPSVDKAAYKAGDIVNLDVLYNKADMGTAGLVTFQFDIPYNPAELEFIGMAGEENVVEPNVTEEDGKVVVRALYFDLEGATYEDASLGTYQFKVIADGVETDAATLSVNNAVVSTMEGEDIYAEGDFTTVAFMIDSVVPVISGIDNDEYVLGDKVTVNITDNYLAYAIINGEKVEAVDGAIEKELLLVPGEYTVEAYDVAGNKAEASFNVTKPEAFTIVPEMSFDSTGYPSEDGYTVKYSSNLLAASNNFGVDAYQFDVTYDPAVYAYEGFESLNDAVGTEVEKLEDGLLRVIYFNAESVDGLNSLKSDDLVAIKFSQAGANGSTVISTSEVSAAVIVNGALYALDVADVADVCAVAVTSKFDNTLLKAGDESVLTVTAGSSEYKDCKLSGFQFDLVFDTSKLEVVVDAIADIYENVIVEPTETGATVLGIDIQNEVTEAIPTDLVAVTFRAKDVADAAGLVVADVKIENLNLTYENGLSYETPACVVDEGSSVLIQYAEVPGEITYTEVPDEDGAVMVPALSFPLYTSEEDALAFIQTIDPEATLPEGYGSGKVAVINGQEIKLIVKGDVNGDGVVNVLDLVAGKEFIFRSAELNAVPQCKQAALDVDDNDMYNVIDLLRIKSYILDVPQN